MIRAARLVRVSGRRQAADDRTSLKVQTETLTKLCADRGWISTAEDLYVEVISGAKGKAKREIFTRLLEAILAGQYQRLCVLDFDRSTRKGLGEWEEISDLLAEAGCLLVVNGQEYDLTDDGAQVTTGILAVVAKAERTKIRKRTIRGLEAKARSGELHVGGVPFGYRRVYKLDGEGKPRSSIEIDPDASTAVREVFTLYAQGQWGWVSLADELNRLGYRFGGTPFRGFRVEMILRNPTYAGLCVRRRPYTWRAQGVKAPPIVVPSKIYPAIVDQPLWDRCQAVRVSRSLRGPMGTPRHPLSGILRCNSCGGPMYFHVSHGHEDYRCATRAKRLGECVAPQFFRTEEAHAAVLGALRKILESLSLEPPAEPHSEGADFDAQLAALDAEEEALLRRLGRPIEEGGIRDDQFSRLNVSLLARRDAIFVQRQRLRPSQVAAKLDPNYLLKLLEFPEYLGLVTRSALSAVRLERVGVGIELVYVRLYDGSEPPVQHHK